MVIDEQVRRLMKYIQKEKTYGTASAKAGMDEKTARKYRDLGKFPSDIQAEHNWRSRKDRFSEVWDEVRSHLEINSGLEAKTLFEDLQKGIPGGSQMANFDQYKEKQDMSENSYHEPKSVVKEFNRKTRKFSANE